uniref:U-scoloptoxin(22)-Er1a n=1 Tax=Ethmostigmus rubripes TaxID=62613 RepID=TXM1A_ETHRU|nr:RecName: Full=U-scoloptoxin(22)-Er1a; Short=U-SLPTX(22)-Er1a; Flags: Precursor [Ethmostigmus rubripes]
MAVILKHLAIILLVFVIEIKMGQGSQIERRSSGVTHEMLSSISKPEKRFAFEDTVANERSPQITFSTDWGQRKRSVNEDREAAERERSPQMKRSEHEEQLMAKDEMKRFQEERNPSSDDKIAIDKRSPRYLPTII